MPLLSCVVRNFTILILLLSCVVRNFTILMLLLGCVVRNFIILILLLSGIGLIIMRSDAGAILLIIQIDGQLGREWKLGCFAVAIRDGLLARPIIGKRA